MTADIVFGRDPVHNNAFSFVKAYIFTRFGPAFTLKRSNGGLGSKKKGLNEVGQKRGFSKTLTSEFVILLKAK